MRVYWFEACRILQESDTYLMSDRINLAPMITQIADLRYRGTEQANSILDRILSLHEIYNGYISLEQSAFDHDVYPSV